MSVPADAWQGLPNIIPTDEKVKYLTQLVSLGFRHIDAVSFVSPKHVPQMADSEAVMQELANAKLPSGESPDIIGIVVNAQGLERALATPGVTTIGYPYSISAYFRRANANMSRAESRDAGRKTSARHKSRRRKLVIYISMAFGNPYDEPWGPEIVEDTLVWLKDVGVRTRFARRYGRHGFARRSRARLSTPRRIALRESKSAFTCTAGPIAPPKKFSPPTKPDAAASMARSLASAAALLPAMNSSATFPPKPCSRRSPRAASPPESTRNPSPSPAP